MRILEKSVYRGPNVFSSIPMIRFMLDLEELEDFPTNRLGGFTENLLKYIPGLADHGCSLYRPGGLLERMREGTWIGHVVEHVALEIQCMAGQKVTRGKTRSVKNSPGVYNVMFAYQDEVIALSAARLALELVSSLLPDRFQSVEGLEILAESFATESQNEFEQKLSRLKGLARRRALGPTGSSLVRAARRRRIPVQRLDEGSLIRLGYGNRQKLIRASITGDTSHLAVDFAGDKSQTKSLLSEAAIPVPLGRVVRSTESALEAFKSLRHPVVIKPRDGNHGKGVSLNIYDEEGVRQAYSLAANFDRQALIEEQFVGNDYRILVINGEVAAVAKRVPAKVIGDGEHTIAELIAAVNADNRRGRGHENVLTEISIDEQMSQLLAKSGLGLESIPLRGSVVFLREAANLSAGGEAIDCTAWIHPENKAMMERAARIIGLDIAGLDVVTPDISLPIGEMGGGIIEINAAPGFRMHLQPSAGPQRDVAARVIDMLYPVGAPSRIPIISVTGTNGKTTTVRMIAHIFDSANFTVGMTTTSGISIDGFLVKAVDASGPQSARIVLADPAVEVAVLETARGGILREGLAYDRADVGIVMNVAADHLGLKGVNTVEDLGLVKSIVAEQVRRDGTAILNADDPLTLKMAKNAGGRVAYFTLKSRDDLSHQLHLHLEQGGILATIEQFPEGAVLVINDARNSFPLIKVSDITATLGGAATFNIHNAQAATLAAYVQGISLETIARALRTFETSFEQNPGRLNITHAPGFTTIVDYAHNPAALTALGELIQNVRPHFHKVIGVVSIPGDRRDEDIREMGSIAARLFDYVVFRERPDGRGRKAGGVIGLLSEGALAGGLATEHMQRILDEYEATQTALRLASPKDLVVVMPTNVNAVWKQVEAFRYEESTIMLLQSQEHPTVSQDQPKEAVHG